MCQVSLGLKEAVIGAHDFKLNFALKPLNINVSRSAAPKQAVVPASLYNSNVKYSYLNVFLKLN